MARGPRRLRRAGSRRLFDAGQAAYREGQAADREGRFGVRPAGDREPHYRRAHRLLRLALRLAPWDQMVRLYLARTERELGQPDASLATISSALARDPSWLPAIRHAIDLQLRLGREEDARRTIEEIKGFDAYSDEDLVQLWRLIVSFAPEASLRVGRELSARGPDPGGLDSRFLAVMTDEGRARAGDERNGLAIADRLARSERPDAVVAAIRTFDHWGRLERALDLVPRIGGADPEQVVSVARMLDRRGFSTAALRALAEAGNHPEAATVRARIEGRLTVLGGWRPQLAAGRIDPVAARVLHLAHASLPHRISGYAVRTHQTALAQREIGLDPHVVTRIGFPEAGAASEVEMVDGIPYHRLDDRGVRFLAGNERLTRYAELAREVVRKLRPSVLHPASDYENALVALALRAAIGIPVVYEVRGFWEDSWLSRQPQVAAESDSYRLRREVNLKCMLAADHVVTLGETMRTEIVSRGVDPEKVSVVSNAIDSTEIHPIEPDRRHTRRLGIDTSDVVVGYVGSVLGYEGLDLLVEAVAQLVADGEPVRCLIVGDGPERAPLESLAARRGIADRVTFAGSVPPEEVLHYYALIDVYAMPRRDLRVCNLVLPLKPYEAMAAGCALVVSDVDALREIVVDGQTGLIAQADDSDALAAVLKRLIRDPRLRSSLAQGGLEWVRRERSWEGNAAAYRAIYERVVGAERPRARRRPPIQPTIEPAAAERALAEAFEAGGRAAVDRWLQETVSSGRGSEAQLNRVAFSVLGESDPQASLAYGQRAFDLEENPAFARKLDARYQALGQLRRALAVRRRLPAASPQDRTSAFLEGHLELLENGFATTAEPDPGYSSCPGKAIYLLHNSLPYASGGYATRSHGLARALRRRGIDVEMVTRLGFPLDLREPPADEPPAQEVIEGVPYRRLLSFDRGWGAHPLPVYLANYAAAAEALAREVRPALVHAASNSMNGVAANHVARALGIPSVYEVRGLWELSRVSRNPQWAGSEQEASYERMEAQAASEATAVLALNRPLRDEMVRRGVAEERLMVVPNAVDAERFLPRERDRELERRLGVEDKVVIGYVGSLVDYEGLDDLLEAVALLDARGAEGFAVLIVGDGPVMGDLKKLADDRGLDALVQFTGRVPHQRVESYYSLIDVVPYPRKPLPVCEMVTPVKPFEAMAMEKAVVASDVDALAEIVEPGATGLLHRKGDAEDLAMNLSRLIDNAELRRQLGEQARSWVLAERSWSVVTNAIVELYAELAPTLTAQPISR